ncbi:MAG: type II toxin-antitoxin system MqsA family antitoxin [Gammaproteobacteria bacterium]|nr:type II toxin-antitoxin system MqsA family antitoxin [Gammaproteobacteria bacterium]
MNSKRSKTRRQTVQTNPTCPLCGGVEVTTSWTSFAFNYGSGESMAELTESIPTRLCVVCKFEYLDEEAERLKHDAVCRHLGVLTPTEIRRIRKEYNLTRAKFAQLTGFGEASLNRWENGLSIQTHAYDQYLRLLRNPSNIRELELKGSISGTPSQTAALPRGRFRALNLTDSLLKAQKSFQLCKAG